MTATSLTRLFVLGSAVGFAACGGEGLTLPPEGEAAHITVLAGDGQSGRVGETLSDSVVVQVTDTRDRPVAGATVNFTFPDADAAASPATATTDADGIAWSKLTLGTDVGPVTGQAQVPVDPGVTPVVATFSAMALPDDANGITLVSGNNQQGPVGSTLSEPLVVEIIDEFGNPISGVTVEWTVEGGGSVSASATPTDASGRASVERTLGTTAGEQRTLASAAGLAGSPVTFIHTALAGTASRIEKVSGDNQSGQTGTELPEPLVVQLFDEENNPIVGRAVTWVPAAGNGTVSPGTSNTDANGLASTRWTLGSAGTNTVNAVVSGVGTATFEATATAGSTSASRSRVDVDPRSIPADGTTASTITVRVRDGNNNRLTGVSVSVSSSGSGNTITPASATTDEDGAARFTFRSTVAEPKTITAVAGGVTLDDREEITVFRLTSTTRITGDSPDPSTSGEQFTVTFSVTGQDGGTPTGTVNIFSDQESGDAASCTVDVSQGSCTITLTVPGTHTLRATYSGDSRYEDSTDPDGESHAVEAAPTPNQPPTAFFVPPTCSVGVECQFMDGSSDSDGTVSGWDWNFGDVGSPTNTSTLQNPTHVYALAGDYTVTLIVTDDDQESSAPFSATVTVQ